MNLFKKTAIICNVIIGFQTNIFYAAEQLSTKKTGSDLDWVTDFTSLSSKSSQITNTMVESHQQTITPEIDSNSITINSKDYIALCKLDDQLRTDVMLKFENPISPTTSVDLSPTSDLKIRINKESITKIISILAENKSLYNSFSCAWKKNILYDENNFDDTSESPIIRLYKKNSTIIKPVLLHYIEKYEACESTCLIESIQYKRLEALQFLIELGVNINKQNRFGMTALHTAYTQGNNEIINLLLVSGAHPHIKNIIGITPDGSCAIS